jgi:Phosphoesterase family
MSRRIRWILPVLAACAVAAVTAASSKATSHTGASTATPIKHVVVIFQENVSFDHYFGTYPYATNTDGNTFTAARGTPVANGLNWNLLAANPNQSNPQRLGSSAADQLTCDQDHDYSDEQQAFDGDKMDQFVQSVGTGSGTSPTGAPCQASTVMDYYDGNVVTGLWNYAQHYAMSDDSFGTTYGPSAPGAINLVAGDTGGVDTGHEVNDPSVSTAISPDGDITPDGRGGYSLTSDAQPYWDDCSTRDAVALKGKNVGDLLNAGPHLLGLVPGRVLALHELRGRPHGHRAERPAGQHVHPGRVRDVLRHCGESARELVEPGSLQLGHADRPRARRHGSVGLQGQLHPAPRAVPVLRVDGESPSPRTDEPLGHRHRYAELRRREAAVRHGQPSVRHERLRRTRRGDHRGHDAGVGTAGGELPQGAGLPGRTRRLLRPTSRSSSSVRSTSSSSRPTGRARP